MATPIQSEAAIYAGLRRAVEAVVFTGRRDIEQAWTRTYHETGRLINEHLLAHEERAGYGARVFERLSADTGISKRTLHECAQFHRCFPIVRSTAQLTRTHYIVLCQVTDEKQRAALLREAIKREWTVAELTEQVRPINAALEAAGATSTAPGSPPVKLLTPRRGTPGVCKVVNVVGPSAASEVERVVDLGFACYLDLPAESGHETGDFVQLDSAGRSNAATEATKADLFTYRATVLKVVDGDTLWVKVYLRPKQWVKQKLRLRDLDCPEMSTTEGKVAKRFTESLVVQAESVTICTTKPDKYDRYLADVFLTLGDSREVFLNNELLANGHAVPKREWEFGDWGE
ncbi:MAG: thermonuclease family protein [Opitutaceae bacterium]|nr:thermonuclease family protein [Opitutaceae bacterium]MBP9912483.1 thermonuclease family protein [Opitutaceae bacterium]